MIVVIMGVSGSGKTTIGTSLAEALSCPFLDADVLHPEANVEAMKDGRSLTDADRAPWLAAVHYRLLDAFHRGDNLVVACSALKHSYRRVLSRGVAIAWVYLKGDPRLIRRRLERRTTHFVKSDLLASQFHALEEPRDAIVVDVSPPPDAIVQDILAKLRETPDIRVLPDLSTLSLRAAETAVGIINDVVRRRGRCSLVLSGGSTPVTLHRILASTYRDRIPWSQVEVFWGDERYVPHEDARSNYRMARETLLDHVPCPAANVHPMPTHFPDADAAARDYQATLDRYWKGAEPHLDLVLLGMGPEGHTASLFPGSAALQERVRWVVATTVPAESPRRLTLTLRALARSANAHFLVSGLHKAAALSHVLSGRPDPTVYPASGVRPAEGRVVWWLDRDAASRLTFE
jgi:6-phosphogluconolactonase